ncbi:MAG: hypothetical protein JF615_02325, partial [Asticcacaulis sp.]|nr:hypothetical protein [Asticcacaulis sp.]
DELVFVDGAYAWVAPFFEKAGLDPARSWQTTHDILAKFGGKVRYFSGVWDDELHKRSFGYSQCTGDIIIRIDADEIFEWDDGVYSEFLRSDKAVAEMEFPYLLTPTSQRLESAMTATPKQCCVFKARYFNSPLEHCAFLWLVLTGDERRRCGQADWTRLYAQPVIRTAHLTAFRTPRTAVNRARFYTLQHVRTTGHLSWSYNQTPVARPEDKIGQIFDFLTPQEYSSWLQGQEIVSGFVHMNGFKVASYRFGPEVTAQVAAAVAACDEAVEGLLDFTAHPRLIVSDAVTLINVTGPLRRGVSRFQLEFADDMQRVTGHLYLLLDTAEDQAGHNLEPVHCHTDGRVTSCMFDPFDMSEVLQAVFVVHPVTTTPDHKTRLVRFTALS